MTKYGYRDNSFKTKNLEVTNKLKITGKVPVQYVVPYLVAAGTSAILSGEDLESNGTAAYDNTGLLVQPPYAMQLHLNWNDAGSAGDSDTLIFVGEDAKGDAISETLTISSAVSGNVYTTKAFAKIDSITPSAVSPCDDIGLGFRANIGLLWPLAVNTDIVTYQHGLSHATTAVDNLTVIGTTNCLTLPTMTGGSSLRIVYRSEYQ